MKKLAVILIAAALVILAFGCGAPGRESGAELGGTGNKLVVYTSFYPLYDFTSKIGGEKVTVKSIVPLGAEPHGFEPSPKDVIAVSEADVLLYVGAGLENWIDKIIASVESSNFVSEELSKYVKLQKFAEITDYDRHGHVGEQQGIAVERAEAGYDPHIWLDPVRAKRISQVIAETLINADPENAGYYRKNYDALAARLDKLHWDYQEGLKKRTSNIIITTHDAFGYLVERYGLESYSIMGISANAEPSSKQMIRLVEFCRQYGVKVIFSESLLNTRASQVLAAEAGVAVLPLHSIAGLTREQLLAGEDYFSLMYKNLASLKTALGCD